MTNPTDDAIAEVPLLNLKHPLNGKSPVTAEAKILAALKGNPNQSGAALSKATGVWSGALYPALYRLEIMGRIIGEWADMPPPRQRLYNLTGEV
jgi:hypothetical protein